MRRWRGRGELAELVKPIEKPPLPSDWRPGVVYTSATLDIKVRASMVLGLVGAESLDELIRAVTRACRWKLVSAFLAGGALVSEQHTDIDIFLQLKADKDKSIALPGRSRVNKAIDKLEDWELRFISPWALTFVHLPSKEIVQLIPTKLPMEEQLLEFDLGCCQVGVDLGRNTWPLTAWFSPWYVQALIEKRPFYTGSQTPVKSLLRIQKYAQRGFPNVKEDLLEVVYDLVMKGIEDPASLTRSGISFPEPEGMDVGVSNQLQRLFEVLHRRLLAEELGAAAPDDDGRAAAHLY